MMCCLLTYLKVCLQGGVTIVESVKKELDTENVVTLKGPSFAVEVMEHADTLLTLGYHYKTTIRNCINKILKNTALHIDCTTDIRGCRGAKCLKEYLCC